MTFKSGKYLFLAFSTFVFAFTACKEGAKETSSANESALNGDLVKNPNSLDGTSSDKLPELTFETLEHDFGKIKEGETVEYDFKFTNTGEAPLIISEVKASCGCTTPSWPKGVIKAGESDIIKVAYDSKGRPGQFNKGIEVRSNTYPNQTNLKITGVVFKN